MIECRRPPERGCQLRGWGAWQLLVSVLVVVCLFPSAALGVGPDVVIDTGLVSSFGASEDAQGVLWVAVGWPDNKLQVFKSADGGESWMSALWFPLDGQARKIEVIASPPSAIDRRVFVFFLTATGAGDLWACSIRTDSGIWENLPVAVGPDTIDDFSVAVDKDHNYYLYCLYVNEQRNGLNGRFTRSSDKGRTWETGQEWWNAADPCISAGQGSVVHAVWRYVGNGREIHYCANRAFGKPAGWGSFHKIKSGGPKCWEPVVAEVDTGGQVVWIFYTVGRRDTALTDLEYAYSRDGGRSWGKVLTLGEPFLNEWSPALKTDRFGVNGFVDLVYRVARMSEPDMPLVVWRSVSSTDPEFWSAPVVMSDRPSQQSCDGCRPRMARVSGHTPRGPLVFFSCSSPDGASGVYCDAPWRPFAFEQPASTAEPRHALDHSVGVLTVRVTGPATLEVYDLSGRLVRLLRVDAGAGAAVWDRRDANGRTVPDGTYVVFVQCACGRPNLVKRLVRICRAD